MARARRRRGESRDGALLRIRRHVGVGGAPLAREERIARHGLLDDLRQAARHEPAQHRRREGQLLVQMLDRGPGDGQSVEGRGAAADFVKDNQ